MRLLPNHGHAGAETRQLTYGQPLHLGRRAGELTVLQGQVWLTCSQDLCDHFLESGQRVWLAAGVDAVVEPAVRNEGASFEWKPKGRSWAAILLAPPLRATACAAGVAALVLTALARNASMGARRMQGSRDW